MGHVPIPPMPTSAAMFLAIYERDLRRQMRGRESIWPWRRRRAHSACLSLIRAREALVGHRPDPWVPRPPRRHPVGLSA